MRLQESWRWKEGASRCLPSFARSGHRRIRTRVDDQRKNKRRHWSPTKDLPVQRGRAPHGHLPHQQALVACRIRFESNSLRTPRLVRPRMSTRRRHDHHRTERGRRSPPPPSSRRRYAAAPHRVQPPEHSPTSGSALAVSASREVETDLDMTAGPVAIVMVHGSTSTSCHPARLSPREVRLAMSWGG